MKIFVTNIPSFYKIRLYNELAKRMPLIVVFTGQSYSGRNKDFFSGELNFSHYYLDRNPCAGFLQFMHILLHTKYDEIIFGGWDNLMSIFAAFFSPLRKNGCVVESSEYESKKTGIHKFVKRSFLKRMSKIYASGKAQANLVKVLGFKGTIIETGGCGILNYVQQPPYEKRDVVRDFLYVGRLSAEKNIEMLIESFNRLPHLRLSIIGYGYQEESLKALANNNISFLGAIANKELPNYYKKSDVFVLPSKSEPWGLVVEEALNNGMPVIVSDMVGCRDSIVSEDVGVVFKYDSIDSLMDSIIYMTDVHRYNEYRKNISKLDFFVRAQGQIEAFTE